MKYMIVAGQPLHITEYNIEQEINEGGFELWGDLDLTYEELCTLRDNIKAELKKHENKLSSICNPFPHVWTTYMVFFMRYEYNYYFWKALASALAVEISSNDYSYLADCAKRMFSKHKMDYSEALEERRKNIAPILYEAGLPPESNLDDLFYVLYYDSHKVFDPQLIIDDLLERRSYIIRKPLRRFLSRFRDGRAIDYILDVRDAMLAVEQSKSQTSRYINNYVDWRNEEKTKKTSGNSKGKEYQLRPYLYFDIGKKGLCLVLPRTVMQNEWVEEANWQIKGDNGYEKTIACNITGFEGKRATQTLEIPVPTSKKYSITLEYSDGLTEKSEHLPEVDGIENDHVTFFNANGRLVKTNYLLWPYLILLIPQSIEITIADQLSIVDQHYPITSSGEFRILSATPIGSEAVLCYKAGEREFRLNMRPQINLSLIGQTLFHLDNEMNLFTEIPTLNVTADGAMELNDLELRVGGKSIPVFIEPEAENAFRIDQLFGSEVCQYGTYSIRLYQHNRFLKQVEFSYVPDIKTNYTSYVLWLSADQRTQKQQFFFQKLKDWDLDFTGCSVSSDDSQYTVEAPAHLSSIQMRLVSIKDTFSFDCTIELPIRPLEAEIIGSDGTLLEVVTGKPYRTGLGAINDSIEIWLAMRTFGPYRSEAYQIRLRTINGIEQSEMIKLTQNGAGNINLSSFSDTLNNCPLPAEIEIICNGDESRTATVVIVTEKLAMERQVYYKSSTSWILLSEEDSGKDIDIVRFGFNPAAVHIPYSQSFKQELKGNTWNVYQYPGTLKDGIYIVSGSKQQSIFAFEYDMDYDLKPDNNILLVKGKRPEDEKGAGQLLENTVKSILFKKPIDYSAINSYTLKELNDYDIELLVALSYFLSSKQVSQAVKKSIVQVMHYVTRKVLSPENRCRIVELLVELKASHEVFDICMREYSLMLLDSSCDNPQMLASQMENYSSEISLLLLMDANKPIKDCISREKYLDLIGRDAIQSMIRVTVKSTPERVKEEIRKFLREEKGCKVRITLDSDITGNQEIITGMIVIVNDKGIPKLDLSKKTDSGVYFCQIKYVDQYINWYKSVHDRNENIKEDIDKEMIGVVNASYEHIERCIKELESDSELGDMTAQYHTALNARFQRGVSTIKLTTNSFPRYFYLQGLAAYLTKLPSERKDLGESRKYGLRFMTRALVIAPRLSRRDIMMAGTYVYLKRKEALLCQ